MKKRAQKQELTEVPEEFDCNPDESAKRFVDKYGFLDGLQRFYDWCDSRHQWEMQHHASLSPLEFDRTGLPIAYSYWRYDKGKLLHRSEF